MASAKFSAFQFASDEFNSDLARLVEGFTQNLLKLIQEECVRNEDSGEDDESGSKKPSPFSSPKGTVGGKVSRKKASPKRGRPVKDDTDVVIDDVNDLRSVSDELSSRVEIVRNSSSSPRVSMDAESKFSSVPVCLDDMMASPQERPENVVEEQTTTKKGKAKKEKVVKEPKEKVVKEPKEKKAPKEKVEKMPKEKKEKVEKAPKEKKEKAEKAPKEKKEKVVKDPKPKKGKKGDASPDTTEPVKDTEPQPISTVLAEEDDNDGLDAEVSASHELTASAFEKTTIDVEQLNEETDYVETGVLSKLQYAITSSQNSQEDDIVIGDDIDDMSQPPPEDEDEEFEEGDKESDMDGDGDVDGDGGDEL
jgi:hypothetical protein